MRKFQALLAATSAGETLALQNGLLQTEQFVVIGTPENGADCVAAVRAEHVDLLILNLKIKDVDGLEVIRRLKRMRVRRPKILALSESTQMAAAALFAGADRSLCLPCDHDIVVHQAVELMDPTIPNFTYEEIDWQACCVFQELGAPIQMEGFRNIRAAVTLLVCQPWLSQRCVTTQLYPAVAELCNSSASRVERYLRSFIAGLYARGNRNGLARYQLNTLPRAKGGCPSNAAFLNAAAIQIDHLLRQKFALEEEQKKRRKIRA